MHVTDSSSITVENYIGQSCWALLGDSPILLKHSISSSSHENQKAPSRVLWIFSQSSNKSRGERSDEESRGPSTLFAPASLSCWSVAVNNECSGFWTIISKERNSAGARRPGQSPVAREMGVSLTTMDKSLMTSAQCTLAPYCYYDKEKCFHKHMRGLEGACFLFTVF